MQRFPEILMVSKAIHPPWNDSSKNLVRDLVRNGRHFRYRVLVPHGIDLRTPSVCGDTVYGHPSAHAPTLGANARVFKRLLVRRGESDIASFFFAPNPKAALAARLALRITPRVAVQTVCSIPKTFEHPRRYLFGERIVVLSEDTRRRLLNAGVSERQLVHIPPGIEPCAPLSPEIRGEVRARHRIGLKDFVAIYPGDYEFSNAANVIARALALCPTKLTMVFACRVKTPAARSREAELDALLRQAGIRDRCRLLNNVPDILQLLGASDVCVFPVERLYAKMDLPLVLLEAMSMAVPIITSDVPPLSELGSAAIGGVVPPEDPEALARCIEALVDLDQRQRCGEAGRAELLARYDIRSTAKRYEDLYQELRA